MTETRATNFVKAYVSGSRTVRTYIHLYKTSSLLLSHAQNSEDDRQYHLMGCLVFAAFTVEAFLNDVGEERVDGWVKKERSFSQQKRLDTVLATVGIVSPKTTLDDVRSAFRFRDGMAHGKSESLELKNEVQEVNWSDLLSTPIQTTWEQTCTVDRCQVVLAACWQLIEEIHTAAGRTGGPFSRLGTVAMSFTRVD